MIIPVPWRPLPPGTPIVDPTIVHSGQALPEPAAKEGVFFLKRDGRPGYNSVVDAIAAAIRDAFREHPLLAANRPRYETVENAFLQRVLTEGGPRHAQGEPGPEEVQFVIAAPADHEIPGRACYGSSPAKWRPFDPPEQSPVRRLAFEVAFQETFSPNDASWTSIDETIETAERRRNLVVVIVDPLSTRIAANAGPFETLDKRLSRNVAVLVPWNAVDSATESGRVEPRALIDAAFQRKLDPKDPMTFVDGIENVESFRNELRKALIHLRGRIQKSTERTKPMPGLVGAMPTISTARESP